MRYKHKNIKQAGIIGKEKTHMSYQINCPYCYCEHIGYWDKSVIVAKCSNCGKYFEIDWDIIENLPKHSKPEMRK